ncbi:MAG: TraR/DksA C4-type zinc finger protein [Myxococcota bacterium]|nr:TraR/DksA C4-type zinc finger protein [Myxococcota bacterium]
MAKVTRRNQADSEQEDVNDFSGETPFSDKELSQFRELLMTEKKAVLQRIGAHVNQATEDQENLADEVDLASRATDQAYLLRLADKEHKLLNQIDRALRKLDDKSYGVCEGTGEPIEKRRLELRPWTRYSLEYKEFLEKDERNRRFRHS